MNTFKVSVMGIKYVTSKLSNKTLCCSKKLFMLNFKHFESELISKFIFLELNYANFMQLLN